ncbi:MAG: nitrite reductase, partial [Anaerolineales bacterium]|nr:nitrite reductase [Anaerolineales bacterium]
MKNSKLWLVIAMILLTLLAVACSKDEEKATETAASVPSGLSGTELAASAIQKGGCSGCHVIPGIPGAVGALGPDLSNISDVIPQRLESGDYTGEAENVEQYLLESLTAPDAFIAPECPSGDCQAGLMPASIGT